MAYYDNNGTITIDEVAAQADINRMTNAISILEQAKLSVDLLAAEAAQSKGETMNAIWEKSEELSGRINKLVANLENSICLIHNTVAHYQALDAQLRSVIEAGGC